MTVDIEKMYRQIRLKDSDFQRIVWRDSPFKPIQDFRLTRIAYGTASAPYLAVKCLQQLAIQEEQNFPLASIAALRDFYVDDLMSGANSTTEALGLQAQLIQMLSSAGHVLRKWVSNCNELTNLIQEDLRLPNASLSIDDGTKIIRFFVSLALQSQTHERMFTSDGKGHLLMPPPSTSFSDTGQKAQNHNRTHIPWKVSISAAIRVVILPDRESIFVSREEKIE
ncbi:reverse transcriptase [Caerostris extrusa]|uniref:Reverse transcriptase n=1 Tax=Caerostris extrusa TaxID=172846 RepID=A0AAV4MSL5_CAEEX|nr:reverse transcriptase [Caerostris extrusa]